jgi:hypothetical protein
LTSVAVVQLSEKNGGVDARLQALEASIAELKAAKE